jgi:hypothetical protein
MERLTKETVPEVEEQYAYVFGLRLDTQIYNAQAKLEELVDRELDDSKAVENMEV